MITAEKMQDVLDFKDEPLTAKVRIYMKTSNLELLFCGHHMRKQEEALIPVAYFNPDWDTELQ